jgi:hypothetical protein
LGAFSNSGEVKVNKKIFFHQYDPALIRKNSKSLSKIPVNYFKTYNESKPIKKSTNQSSLFIKKRSDNF